MKITRIDIANYRNLSANYILFDPICNFIVGDNNIGKSNVLRLLEIILNRRNFNHDDFADPNQSIEVKLSLKLSNDELGHFEDYFDADDYSKINIICRQNTVDDNISYCHAETETPINPSSVRCINYIHYDSLRNPINEIDFNSKKGIGRFLSRLVFDYLEKNNLKTDEIIDISKTDELISGINDIFSKMKSFQDYQITSVLEGDITQFIPKLINIQDGGGNSISKTGYGVQFMLLIALSLLEKLQVIYDQRKDVGLFVNDETGEKSISLILGLDEPETHLHPYMQRSIIKYLNKIVNNNELGFGELIKSLFDIDKLDGQIIVATHSPNIILESYKQIIRLYKDNNGATKIVSGTDISISEQDEKHLMLHFPFIKEAFFAKAAIFVEGDSEYASFPLFARTMGFDLDDFGITVIQAGGNSVPQLIELANKFFIPCVGINDSDGDNSPTGNTQLFKTEEYDYEAELMKLIDNGKGAILRDIILNFDPEKDQRIMEAKAINKRAHKRYQYITTPTTDNLKLADIPETDNLKLKLFYSTWFGINKSQQLGRLIGQTLKASEIPDTYKAVINKAKDLC